jgi:hypothetical protein
LETNLDQRVILVKLVANENLLGAYLKDRRKKLDPAAFGLPLERRRDPQFQVNLSRS